MKPLSTDQTEPSNTESAPCPENLDSDPVRPFPCRFVTSHQTDAANRAITITRPAETTQEYTVSYATLSGFLVNVDLHFATRSGAGLTDQVLLAIPD